MLKAGAYLLPVNCNGSNEILGRKIILHMNSLLFYMNPDVIRKLEMSCR